MLDRMERAAVRFLGGDYRRALPEFDALAGAFARTAGPAGDKARFCRAQAAHCRAELGQVTVALQEFEAVLRQVRAVDSDASEEVIELQLGARWGCRHGRNNKTIWSEQLIRCPH